MAPTPEHNKEIDGVVPMLLLDTTFVFLVHKPSIAHDDDDEDGDDDDDDEELDEDVVDEEVDEAFDKGDAMISSFIFIIDLIRFIPYCC